MWHWIAVMPHDPMLHHLVLLLLPSPAALLPALLLLTSCVQLSGAHPFEVAQEMGHQLANMAMLYVLIGLLNKRARKSGDNAARQVRQQQEAAGGTEMSAHHVHMLAAAPQPSNLAAAGAGGQTAGEQQRGIKEREIPKQLHPGCTVTKVSCSSCAGSLLCDLYAACV